MRQSASPIETPIDNFSQCHVGILSHLDALAGLPALVDAAESARKLADKTLRFFSDVVYEHHQEEERALFTAVLASTIQGEEHDRVAAMIDQLTREHRQIEALCDTLAPHMKRIAKGHFDELDTQALETLVRDYAAHAAFEEQAFLPLSEKILGRNSHHMAALGVSLHMRHTPMPLPYI